MKIIKASRKETRRSPRGRLRAFPTIATVLLLAFVAAPIWSQSTSLTIDQAVKAALDNDTGIQSAVADWNAGVEQAVAARLRMLPSLSLSAGYTRLSSLPEQSIDIPITTPLGTTTTSFSFPSSPTDAFSFAASLRYPVFTGFRLEEAAKIADLKAMSKQATLDMMRQAIAYEVRRAYWGTVRADANVRLMKKSLQVTKAIVAEVRNEVAQGLATDSDRLAAEQRQTQAQMALSDSESMRDSAYLTLANLMGRTDVAQKIAAQAIASAASTTPLPYKLSSSPATSPTFPHTSPLDLSALVASALSSRGDLRAASLGVEMAQHAKKAAAGGFYPTVAAIGDYTYANPNQRVFPPKDEFTGTWDVGVQLSFDVGGVPAVAAQTRAADKEIEKARLQREKQRNAAVLDVQTSTLALLRARKDLAMSKSAVEQAQEDLRVTQAKLKNGEAKHTDLLISELGLLKAQFALENREIEVQIAADDLARAAAVGLP